ncbi:hypothetical protein CBS101457_006687 [Exobasidium rhododendri]|nr:hypothetical protein CBS101457_006687 [Exobasidium rhododendri]
MLVLLLPIVTSQTFQILLPPATPTTTDVVPGPLPTAANLTAQPLPDPPSPALSSVTYTVADTPPDGAYMSIGVPSNLLGISIELSVANDYLGDKIGEPAYQLLNYLEAIRVRAGQGAVLRIGGNTQDTAIYDVNYGGVIEKIGGGMSNGVPVTPTVEYSTTVFNLIAQVAIAVDSKVIWGVNMVNDSAGFTTPMIAALRDVIKSNLLFYLVGNEPDRYESTGRRMANYTQEQYLEEWGNLTSKIITTDYSDAPRQFAAPSVCCYWTTEQILSAGMLSRFTDRLSAITAIQYPQSLCSDHAPYGHAGYMNQSAILAFTSYDTDAVTTAVEANIPYYIVETNSASCVGVQDVADTFTTAVWSVNMALQFAYRNHTGVLLHNGGQSTLYNIFTPPAYNFTTTAWRTHPIFYSLLVVAEALRSSNDITNVTVTDQLLPSNLAAAYNIYEDGAVLKKVFINMVNDPSGGNDLKINFPTPASSPSSVAYKILTAPTLAEKENITWAGQTFGYYSEGLLVNDETILQAPCQGGNCTISVPAPGVALVFLSDTLESQETPTVSAFQPVGTNNPQIILSSNGDRGRRGGATSKNSARSAAPPALKAPSKAVTLIQSISVAVSFAALAVLLC